MFLLDHKIPKYLDPLKEKMLSEFWSENSDSGIRPSSKVKSENALSCLLNNIVKNTAFGLVHIPITLDKKQYSEPLIYNATLVNRKVSYAHTIGVLNWLHNSGRAIIHKGGVDEWHIGAE